MSTDVAPKATGEPPSAAGPLPAASSADEALLALVRHDEGALAAGLVGLHGLDIFARQALVDAACLAAARADRRQCAGLMQRFRQVACVLTASGDEALEELREQLARMRKTQQLRGHTPRATVARFG